MHNKRKIIILLCLILSILLSGCTDSNNEIIKEFDSPNGKYTAFYFVRDLGATTKASYQLSVLEKGKKLGDSSGNIFITYGEFDTYWENDTLLVVNIKNDEEIFKQSAKYEEIEIKYQNQ